MRIHPFRELVDLLSCNGFELADSFVFLEAGEVRAVGYYALERLARAERLELLTLAAPSQPPECCPYHLTGGPLARPCQKDPKP